MIYLRSREACLTSLDFFLAPLQKDEHGRGLCVCMYACAHAISIKIKGEEMDKGNL